MSKIRVKLNQGNIRSQLLKGGGAPGLCVGIANSMANKAGLGYAVRVVNYPERTGAIVYPKTEAAKANNYSSNTLEKARGGKYQ